MSQFARLLSSPENRTTIQNMQNPSDIGDFILHRIIERDIAITARDIMRDPVDVVQPDMPLREVTRFMNQRELDTVAVCEPDGTLVGEITCNNLFKLGMPDKKYLNIISQDNACSACYSNLAAAVEKLKDEGLTNQFAESICIGQGYKGETGNIGIGDCTSEFQHYVHGCPPSKEEITDFLRAMVNEGKS